MVQAYLGIKPQGAPDKDDPEFDQLVAEIQTRQA